MPRTAQADRVGREELLAFVRPRHKATLVTRRSDGSLQMSPVACGVDQDGRVVVSTYPQRAKAVNARRDPRVSLVVHSDDWDDPYVQVDGTAEVLEFLRHAGGEFTYTSELIGARRLDDAHWVAVNRLEGDFPGGVAELDYRFTLADDLITELFIGS